jgi:hypothetical protein
MNTYCSNLQLGLHGFYYSATVGYHGHVAVLARATMMIMASADCPHIPTVLMAAAPVMIEGCPWCGV